MCEDLNDFKSNLRNKIVSFKYTKKDGTIREANGTVNLAIIEGIVGKIEENQNKRQIKVNENVTKYFDIDKSGWRSFNNDSFIGFQIDEA